MTHRELKQVIRRHLQSIKDVPRNQWTAGLIESHLQLSDSYWVDFKANYVMLLQEFGDEKESEPYFAEGEYHQAETDHIEARAYLYDIQDQMSPSTSRHLSIPHQTTPVGGSRLPRITVSPFNSDPQQWESFRDLFLSLIHGNSTLRDVVLQYRKTLVTGEAQSATQNIPITRDNYEIAWSTLQVRFDNKYLLVQSHMHSLKRIR